MTEEAAFIAALRRVATDPAARGLADDAAVLEVGGKRLVLTHDMIAEGVHFLSSDPPEDVAWKLVTVNLSDLAAKGARPLGLLVGYCLGGGDGWDEAFVRGLGEAAGTFGAPLLGGDTVALPKGAPRTLGLTAVGEAHGPVPSRAGAKDGDALWVSGTIGDAGLGLRIALGQLGGPPALLERYRRPEPRLALGQALAPFVGAMMDVSDGLLIDAARMAEASGLAVELDLAAVPLSEAFVAAVGDARAIRLDAAVAGDDYELLFAAAQASLPHAISSAPVPLTRIGRFRVGHGVSLSWRGEPVPLPSRLGYEHAG